MPPMDPIYCSWPPAPFRLGSAGGKFVGWGCMEYASLDTSFTSKRQEGTTWSAGAGCSWIRMPMMLFTSTREE